MKIFLIEDDAISRLIFKKTLEIIDPFLILKMFSNGKEAITYLKEEDDLPEILFLDLNMPVLNGFEFLTILEAHNIQIPGIVMMSSYYRDEDKETLLGLGCTCFLDKPIVPIQLEAVIKAFNNAMIE